MIPGGKPLEPFPPRMKSKAERNAIEMAGAIDANIRVVLFLYIFLLGLVLCSHHEDLYFTRKNE